MARTPFWQQPLAIIEEIIKNFSDSCVDYSIFSVS